MMGYVEDKWCILYRTKAAASGGCEEKKKKVDLCSAFSK